jgi:hypothetical protein
MSARCFLLIIIALLSSAAICSSQTFDLEHVIGDGPASARQISARVSTAPDGSVYVVWADFRDGGAGQVYLARSEDRGATFLPSRRLTNARQLQSGIQLGPQLAIDRSNNLHLIWQELGSHDKITVRYARSTDRGLSFGAALDVTADSGLYYQDFPSLAVDSSGNPYVAWIDSREQETGSSLNTQLFVARSHDGGVSFEKPVRATYMPRGEGGTCECCNTSIAVSRSGNVFVSFRSNIRNDRDIYVARSLDGGATFRLIKAASERWHLNACPMTGSSIAVDRDETAHVVWRDSRLSSEGKDYIYYTSLRLADTVCAPDRRISSTPTKSNYPSLGITPDGGLLCAFQDNRNDAADIYVTSSTDGGATFSTDTKLTNESGSSRQELPSVAIADDGTRYVVWQDTRNGVERIMLTRAEPGTSSAVVLEGSLPTAVSLWPSPVRAGEPVTLELTSAVAGSARIVIFDMTGRIAAAPYRMIVEAGEQILGIDISTLPPGAYICTLEYTGGRIARSFVVR